MGFIIYYLVLLVNPMGRILVRRKWLTNNLEIVCHPICNRMYLYVPRPSYTQVLCATHLPTLTPIYPHIHTLPPQHTHTTSHSQVIYSDAYPSTYPHPDAHKFSFLTHIPNPTQPTHPHTHKNSVRRIYPP